MRLLLTGGGTFGSVTPLLAVREQLKPEKTFWIGTRNGQERAMIERAGILFYGICSGKFRRYFDIRNCIDPLFIIIGFVQSLLLLIRIQPTHVLAAAGFVGVPVCWAAWLLRIPVYLLQQDVCPSFSNILTAWCAKKIFVVFKESAKHFSSEKVVVTGNAIRSDLMGTAAQSPFALEKTLPTVLVIGGGTGAQALNEIVERARPALTEFCQLIHSTGRKKRIANSEERGVRQRYHAVDFLTEELAFAYRTADLVVTRAGMGVLSELAALKKAALVVPLPKSHQEENSALLASAGAAVVVAQRELTPERLVAEVRTLLSDANRLQRLSEALRTTIPTDGARRIAEEMNKETSAKVSMSS